MWTPPVVDMADPNASEVISKVYPELVLRCVELHLKEEPRGQAPYDKNGMILWVSRSVLILVEPHG